MRHWASFAASLTLTGCFSPLALQTGTAVPTHAKGIVFEDKNLNGKRDPGEPGIPGVKVSNQKDIVITDKNGSWKLPADNDTIFFVIKPRGWMTPVDNNNLPKFYYIHKPKGSPDLKYRGVAPTGPLPESIDFPLHKQEEPNKFRAIFFGDTQPRNQREIEYIKRDVIPELIGVNASFGVTLGDVVFDDLSLFEPLNQAVALIGIPWYNVLGNHDINFDSPDDKYSDETWERVYGPSYYSFDYGPVHFIVVDDIHWTGATPDRQGRYVGKIGTEQMEFIKKDLALIPKNQLVVLMMHIPLVNVEDRQELYRLIEQRPYSLSVSAHTHYQEHVFIKEEDGWKGPKPHHHVIHVTVCGSWWQGAPDALGIPSATMRDGAPNGYSIFTFDGHTYSIEFKAARRPSSYQMNIWAPDSISRSEAAQTEIVVNVFGGSERSKVDMRLGASGDWIKMTHTRKEDPYYAEEYERARSLAAPYIPLPRPMQSGHLWTATLPQNPPKGVHPLWVRSVDMFGQTYIATRPITIK
jgi:hypothetical protein